VQTIEVFNVNESAELSERDLEAIAIGPANCSCLFAYMRGDVEPAHVISDGLATDGATC